MKLRLALILAVLFILAFLALRRAPHLAEQAPEVVAEQDSSAPALRSTRTPGAMRAEGAARPKAAVGSGAQAGGEQGPEARPGEAAGGDGAGMTALEALAAPPLVDRPPHKDDGTPLEVVTRRSLALVLELNGRGAVLRRRVAKELPYRLNNRRASGRYAFQIQDGEGRELFTGGFDAPELCPLGGAGHDAPHQNGHVFLEHSTSVLLRVPRFPAGARLVVYRNIPTIDPEPSLLATLPLD